MENITATRYVPNIGATRQPRADAALSRLCARTALRAMRMALEDCVNNLLDSSAQEPHRQLQATIQNRVIYSWRTLQPGESLDCVW